MPAISAELRRVAITVGERNRSVEAALRAQPANRLQLKRARRLFDGSNDLGPGDVARDHGCTSRHVASPLVCKLRSNSSDASMRLPLRSANRSIRRQLRPLDRRIADVDQQRHRRTDTSPTLTLWRRPSASITRRPWRSTSITRPLIAAWASGLSLQHIDDLAAPFEQPIEAHAKRIEAVLHESRRRSDDRAGEASDPLLARRAVLLRSSN